MTELPANAQLPQALPEQQALGVQHMEGAPDTPGVRHAQVVREIGARVTDISAGDDVRSLAHPGEAAELGQVDAEWSAEVAATEATLRREQGLGAERAPDDPVAVAAAKHAAVVRAINDGRPGGIPVSEDPRRYATREQKAALDEADRQWSAAMQASAANLRNSGNNRN